MYNDHLPPDYDEPPNTQDITLYVMFVIGIIGIIAVCFGNVFQGNSEKTSPIPLEDLDFNTSP